MSFFSGGPMLIHRAHGLIALCAVLLSGCARTPAPIADADRDTIRMEVDNFTKAMLAGDFATAASYYTEDAMLLPPNAPAIEGRAAIQNFFTTYPKISAFTQKIVELDASGELAWARLTYELTMTPAGAKASLNDSGKTIIIMKKQLNGTWQTSRAIWNSDLTARTVIASQTA